MSEKIDQIRTLLSELEKELRSFAEKDKRIDNDYDSKFPDYGAHKDENAMEVEEYGRELSREQILEKILENVVKALKKIPSGMYGICEKCGEEIGEERLRILYQARLCVGCKSKAK